MADADILKKNLKRKGYEKAAKEALLEMAISNPTKSRHSIEHQSANVTSTTPCNLSRAEETEVMSRPKIADNMSEQEINAPVTVRRSPGFEKEPKEKLKDDEKQRGKKTVEPRRSERLRQKYTV